ncbi:MAG: ornithine carbamoyltransferase [Candidatus Limnocylindrales bacterium]
MPGSTDPVAPGAPAPAAGQTRHYLTVASLSPQEFARLLSLSRRMKETPAAWRQAIPAGKLAMIFDKPSTRTRVSFEAAAVNLGMHPLMLRPDELQIGRGEPPQDTARVLSRLVDAIAWRTFSHERLEAFASYCTIPVVNALTDTHHPCQALADLMTIEESIGSLPGRRLAYVGDGNNVAHSLIEAGALAGLHVVLATPEGYEPDGSIVAAARERGRQTGASVEIVRDPAEAVREADAVYTDVWTSMGEEQEREARRQAFRGYVVSPALMALAAPHAIFLHCLPAHRGEEVEEAVIEGPRSRVWDEAENRLWTEQAVLYALLTGDWRGDRIG